MIPMPWEVYVHLLTSCINIFLKQRVKSKGHIFHVDEIPFRLNGPSLRPFIATLGGISKFVWNLLL